MPNILYSSGKGAILNGALERPLRVIFAAPGYKPDVSHKRISEASGLGYPLGGVYLEHQRINAGTLYADDILLPKATISAAGVAIVSDKGVLIAYVDFEGTKTSTNGPFEVKWDSKGILSL